MNFLRIAWRDISSIFKNRFIRVSVVAIIVVPLLYSLLYLAAFWDPYGDMTKMPVAVVNLDKGQTEDGQAVNYGKDMIDKLKNNKKVGWNFVSKEEGKSGLDGDKYYAEFIIPEDFSKKVTSAKNGKPDQAHIIFVSNDKKNFLASQINGKVEVALKDEIANSVTKEYTKVTFDNLYDVKDGMNKAVDGSKKLADGLGDAKDGSFQLKDGLSQFDEKIGQANDKMNKYKYLLPLLNEKNLNSVDKMMGYANKFKDVNIDPSMLSMLNTFSSKENVENLKNTAQHVKDANISGMLNSPEVNAISNMIAKVDLDNVKKISNAIDMDKIKPMLGLLDESDKMTSIMEDTQNLNKDVENLKRTAEKNKLVKGLLTDKDKRISILGKMTNIVDQADKLNSINLDKYKPMLGLLNHTDKISKIMSQADELNKLDITKLQPMMGVLQNTSKLNSLMSTAEGLAKMDIAPTQQFLNAQKLGAQKFIASADILNTDANKKNLELAINTNANLKGDQKTQLIKLLNGYYGLVDGTKTNMLKANDTINKSIVPNLTVLQSAQSQLQDKGTVDAIKAVKTAMAPSNIVNVTDMMTKLQNMKATLSDPETKALIDSIKNVMTQENINDIKTMLRQVETMKVALNDTETKALMNMAKEALKENKIQDITVMMGKIESLKNKVSDEKLLKTIKTAMTSENIAYMKNLRNQFLSIQPELDNNIAKIKDLQAAIAKLDPKKVESIKGKIETLKADMVKAEPLINKLQGVMTPSNIEKIKKAPELVNSLSSMQNDLKDNAEILGIAAKALNKGNLEKAKKLIEAIPAMTEGVNKLANGSNDLYDGIVKLHDGSTELNDKLSDGSNDMNKNLINSSEDMGEFVSKPVTVKDKPINPVNKYGAGFAPYFMPLSLWVGAIMMFFVITDKVDDDLDAKGHSIVTGKFLSYGFIGVLQAVLVSIAVMALGLRPTNIVLYFAVNIFMSYVFIAIIQSLVFLLGDVGRLLATILLLLQLTSSAGTFPIELVPKFFQVVNPYLPFTYGIEALREVSFATNINYALLGKDLTILAGMLVGFLMISVLMKNRADKVQTKIKQKMQKAA